MSAGSRRLGVDIGGTFTDAVLIDDASGETWIRKVLTTPSDASVGFAEGVDAILDETSANANGVAYVAHATTVATNAIIERKTARTALITTEGFRDILEIARQIRPSLYDLRFVKPEPLVPRYLCFGIRERLDPRGEVVVPVDRDNVRSVVASLQEAEVESVAVCLLHSYVNPEHEYIVGRTISEALPGIRVSLSCEVCPEIREYVRASTTVINAAVSPLVEEYLGRVETRLQDAQLGDRLLVMQSNGGVFRMEAARKRPVYMVESGPAAGVIAAAFLGTQIGHDDIISFDMGGTTAKVGLIQKGRPQTTREYEIGMTARAAFGAGRGGGYPILTPVIDLVEIGAGGGSIAWVDAGGRLRVGPNSAGADPGPACYKLGGRRPTVTDANLVLGRLSPTYFLGGEMALDLDAARDALERECGSFLGLSSEEAALSIVEVANAAMTSAIRLISVQRGYDPREFALIAFGGAGPAHANRVAEESEIPTVIIPPSPGITSAMGLVTTDLKHEYSASVLRQTSRVDEGLLSDVFERLEAAGRKDLDEEGVEESAVSLQREVDLRYIGQSYELTLPFAAVRPGMSLAEQLTSMFHDEHKRAYGFNAPDDPTEVVGARVVATGHIAKPALRRLADESRDMGAVIKERRTVWFSGEGAIANCPVYDRYQLKSGARIEGPAIVEETDSTTVIQPHFTATTTEHGFLMLSGRSAFPKARLARK